MPMQQEFKETDYKLEFEKFVLSDELKDFYRKVEIWFATGPTNTLKYFNDHFVRFNGIIELCKKNNIKPKKVCEIGSFFPFSSYYFKTINPDTTIDLYDIIIRNIADLRITVEPYNVNGIKLIDFNLNTDKFPDKKYDLVIMSEVMEHLPCNLFGLEKRVIGLLKNSSYLVITYPMGNRNVKNYEKDLDLDFEKSHGDWGNHLREFNRETTPLFFKDLIKMDETTVNYIAYGIIQIILYKKKT